MQYGIRPGISANFHSSLLSFYFFLRFGKTSILTDLHRVDSSSSAKNISRYDCRWFLNQAVRLDRWGGGASVTAFMESENIPLMFFLDIRDELPKSPYMAAKGRLVLVKGNNQRILGMWEYQNGAGFCNLYGSIITQKFRNSFPVPFFTKVFLSQRHMCTSLIPIWKLRIEIS
jgi:hypothetical protein